MSQPCPLPSFLRTLLHWLPEPGEGSRNAATIMSSPTGSPFAEVIQSLAGLHQEHHKVLLDMRARLGKEILCPRPEPAGGPRACSGAGWTGRFGPGGVQQPRPRPPTCRYRRWGCRTTRRRSSIYLRRPQRHVGGPRRTGQCASSPC